MKFATLGGTKRPPVKVRLHPKHRLRLMWDTCLWKMELFHFKIIASTHSSSSSNRGAYNGTSSLRFQDHCQSN